MTSSQTRGDQATMDVDLWADDVLLNPYPTYQRMREQGPAVFLEKYGLWALTQYDAVAYALGHHEIFSSRHGVAVNEDVNQMVPDILIHLDGELHSKMRGVLSPLLSPRRLRKLEEEIDAEADALVEHVVRQGEFDGMQRLANILPVSVLGRLVGLPDDRRMRILDWADCSFTIFGPPNERSLRSFADVQDFFAYLMQEAAPDKLAEDSWGRLLYDAADRGEIPPDQPFQLMFAFTGAGMDTTISAIGSAMWLFAKHPEQWERVRQDPSLIIKAFIEVVRLETPIQYFTRMAEQDHAFGDQVIPAGSRTLLMYGCANRDERKWPLADTFDVTRNPVDHLGFGRGVHTCVGQPLARVEAAAVFKALVKRVKRFHVTGEPQWQLNNMVRRLKSLPMAVELD